jgi:putative endonuclease
MSAGTNQLGRIGEDLAVRHLKERGYLILARNWRAAVESVRGEVDVIAQQGSTLVFCEVKSRRRSLADNAFAAVTYPKQRQIRRLAALYLADREGNAEVRFDVIAVFWPPTGGGAVIDHILGAF